MLFQGQTIIITGAASGIGLATARQLAAQGARLVLWDVDEGRLHGLAAELGAMAAVVDVAEAEQVAQAMQAAAESGPITAVIHAAGILATGLFTAIPLARQTAVVRVNLLGSVHVAYAAVPHLRGTRGSLILLASASALYGTPEYASYGASKAGVLSLAQAVRVEEERAGVHVGVVIPSYVDTPMNSAHNPGMKLYERFGVAHTADDVAMVIIQHGLVRRKFHIWPSLQPRLLYYLGLLTNPFGQIPMRLFWR